ncbi:MAG: thiamine pyrophosphate-binding protein [Polaromonas sp.]|uniref:thiamine pyrophosphate-binding protein n=1 Tax=Polaromonas sp. TaxID=1869339 RepID=UPI0025D50A28|nr:thiamine pyrophosphate-binding protein [Polaromonas sp.]MBI2729035.1 thiamine pyrophosphate-binding protein [Polaromonas sp.]
MTDLSKPPLHSTPVVRRDIPQPSVPDETVWGSDAIADMMRAMDIPYVLLNPGASFRGLHDSLVNHLGNEKPQMIVVLHEEHAVAIAQGYAKVTGKPLCAILHSNVGLMHGSMGIFDAWTDRMPVIVLGATGPVDAAKRRPWIDWIHTAQDQAALIRHFIKWDAQPASIPAAQEALLRAVQIATTAPQGPVYVCFDAALQESKLDARPKLPDYARYKPAPPARPSDESIDEAAELLSNARRPVILMGRVSRSEEGWADRIRLAEKLNAEVLTDLKVGAAFPTTHPLYAAPAGTFLSPGAMAVLKDADVVLSLDFTDLAGTLKQAWGNETIGSKVINVSVDQYVHNGWSMDHQGLPPMDIYMMCEPEPAVKLLADRVKPRKQVAHSRLPVPAVPDLIQGAPLTVPMLSKALKAAVKGLTVSLIRAPLSWSGEMWDIEHPLDYLGYEGGGGVGAGPGVSIGAALALKGTDRLPVAVMGDGDYMMGVNALWTASNAQIPLLIIVVNNRSFFNDEVHQERVARQRGRPVENKWIGQRISNPAPDLAMMARGQGMEGIGPIETGAELEKALAEAIKVVQGGKAIVLDVIVSTGYSAAMTAGLTRSE